MAEGARVEEAADELYGLPPGEFTRARDARAKELRGAGERDAANAVKALRRPTVAAWALNQLARRRRKDLDALLSAGADLRAAQEELLAGGDRGRFQDAAAGERDLVAKLTSDALTLASEVGERGSALREKIGETLHAAALDEDTAAELRAGRLVREREAIGGFGGAMAGAAPAAAPRRRPAKKPAAGRSPRSQPRRDRVTRAGGPDARPAASAARADERKAREARQALTVARTDERHARRELDAAERAVQHAQERAAAAEAHAKEAAERARTTADRLKEAKRAQTAARRTHARAQKALEKAENARS